MATFARHGRYLLFTVKDPAGCLWDASRAFFLRLALHRDLPMPVPASGLAGKFALISPFGRLGLLPCASLNRQSEAYTCSDETRAAIAGAIRASVLSGGAGYVLRCQ
jgi:hypothetical protein